jgi:hypothetical protein
MEVVTPSSNQTMKLTPKVREQAGHWAMSQFSVISCLLSGRKLASSGRSLFFSR